TRASSTRRHALSLGALALVAIMFAPMRAAAQDKPVRIGDALSRTGIFAAAAQSAQEPYYVLWAEKVNAAGGLDVKGTKRNVDVVANDAARHRATLVRT